MNFTSLLLWTVPVVVIGGLLWFVADMRFAQRWGLRRAELGAEDNARELEAHFERALRCRRPMLLIFQRFVLPGLLEADFALHVSNQGEHERALNLVRVGTRKAARRIECHLTALPAEAMILLRLGRYAEAREVIRHGRNLLATADELAKSPAGAGLAANIAMQEGLLELNLGNLDAALKLGVEASNTAVSDPGRALVSGALCAKGRFQEALAALVYDPSGFYKFLKPADLELLDEDDLFCETARRADEETMSVFGPAIHLGRAQVYLDAGDALNFSAALEQARSKLRSHKIMEHIFVRMRACSFAMTGDIASVEADLARARELAAEKPASRSAKYETHLAAGRARFLLGQHSTAVEELNAASRWALHPMEKHTATYWLGRAHQTAQSYEASTQFKAVLADAFGTWMEADARIRLG